MSGSENVQAGMSSDDPKSVMFASKSVETSTLGHIPNPDGLVLGVGEDQLLPRVEDGAGHVVVVTTARVHLPGLQCQLVRG